MVSVNFINCNKYFDSICFVFTEEVEEDEGASGPGQEEYMKEQQNKLAAERQKLLENHDMVESVSV